jgi:hypothetical protein
MGDLLVGIGSVSDADDDAAAAYMAWMASHVWRRHYILWIFIFDNFVAFVPVTYETLN